MSNQRIKIPRAADKLVVSTFRDLGSKFGVSTAHISALGYANLGSVNLADEGEEIKALLRHDSALIESVSIAVAGLHIAYHRGGNYPAESKSGIFDEVVFTNNANQSASNGDRIECIAFISKKLKAFDPKRAISGVSEEQTQLLAIHEGTLERLERLNEELIRGSATFREDLERKLVERLEASESDYRNRQAALDDQYQEKEAALVKREETVTEKLRKIDDRNNTHVRREIRDRMLDDVKTRIERFGVSPATAAKRVPVRWGILLMTVAFAILLGWTAMEIHSLEVSSVNQVENKLSIPRGQSAGKAVTDQELAAEPSASGGSLLDRAPLYLLWARFTLFSFGLFGSILYYIKWQNHWANQHAAAEFQLQQFYVDVNRANWVIESCLEWRKETSSAIPRELLQSITSGLFTSPGADQQNVLHPADELASALLGSASKVKLNVGGNEIEFTEPGKRLKKASNGEPS